MPPPLPSSHRGMTANPLKPVSRYRPGKPIAAEESSSEEEEEEAQEEHVEAQRDQERRRKQAEAQRRRQQAAPSAKSFPASQIAKGVQGVKLQDEEQDDDDEEGFVTEEEDEGQTAPGPPPAKPARQVADGVEATVRNAVPVAGPAESDEEEEDEEEESSEEESSSEDEAPRRVLLRPTFIKKDKRGNAAQESSQAHAAGGADSAADSEARQAQRQEKADMLVRDQLEKDAIARTAGHRAWDDDELVEADEEGAIDDRDGVDAEAEYAAWKLRELKRVKRSREAIEEAEKEHEEIERRRNLTAEERDREDREFLAKQKEEREATRGQTGFMQRYFHKGAFFRDDLEREGLDRRNLMGAHFADDVARDTLPQYMQVRDMTKLGKKGRTRYRDLKTEDTGRFGGGYENRFGARRESGPPIGVTDERFLPDRDEDRGAKGPTGANASVVRPRRRSRSRSASPRRDHSAERSRKRSPSPYDDSDKRRRVDSAS